MSETMSVSKSTSTKHRAHRELDRLGVSSVPPGWKLSTVGSACSIRNDLRLPLSTEVRARMTGPYPYYGPTGILDSINEYRAEGEFALIGEDGDHFLNSAEKAQTIRVGGRFNVNNHAHLITHGPACTVDWFFHFFRNRDIAHSLTRQGAGRFKLTKYALERLPILLPPLSEQRMITQILWTWDEALKKLETLRAVKRDALTGISRKLLRLDGDFADSWSSQPLSTISSRVRRQNDGGNHPVMTISAKSGFLMQSDKFRRDMAGSSVEKYIVLHEGEFAYNKGNSLTAPYGCVFRLNRATALVPFVYFCFALKKGLSHDFFAHLFASGALHHQLSRIINSGVRNDGLLNLDVDDFFECRVPVPPLDEQEKIAAALSAAKSEIELLSKEIDYVTRQKRGLMQKLLTGEWRVGREVAVA